MRMSVFVQADALAKSDCGFHMLSRANIGSENNMFNIHGQVWELPWNPSRGFIKLHLAKLHSQSHTHTQRERESECKSTTFLPTIRKTSKLRANPTDLSEMLVWFPGCVSSHGPHHTPAHTRPLFSFYLRKVTTLSTSWCLHVNKNGHCSFLLSSKLS